MERVMVTLPADLLQAVDDAAERGGKKRSQVVRQALREWLESQRRQELEALMAEGYQEMAEEAVAIAEEILLAQAAAAEGIWRWDD